MSQKSPHQNKIIFLGPQPRDFRDVAQVVSELDFDKKIGLISAGWQENELDHSALIHALDRETVNLELHGRSEIVAEKEEEFVQAWALRQKHLRHLQEFYRVRLDAIDEGARTIAVRHVSDALLEEQREITVAQLRHLDDDHLRRCRKLREEFDEKWRPFERPALAEHREAIGALIEDCGLLLITGGHVVALLNRMRLFSIPEKITELPIVAWSAGAMTLTEKIVLFHDSPPFGKNLAQVLDFGLGFCSGVVALPDLSRRVNLDQTTGIGRFAKRMAPSRCIGLDPGGLLTFEKGELVDTKNSALMKHDGSVQWEWKP